MTHIKYRFLLICFVFCLIGAWTFSLTTYAHNKTREQIPLRIAVAANFAPALHLVLANFTKDTGIPFQVITAATGVLYQQIQHGAPFDVFLSADSLRPSKLEEQGYTVANSRKTYALGQLALWSSRHKQVNYRLEDLTAQSEYIAIANPELAPYGKAAKQALISANLWAQLERQLVIGININQTFMQVRSQAVPWAIVAASQLSINQLQGHLIDSKLYAPIKQQLVILKRSELKENAQRFVHYLLADRQQQQLTQLGYKVSND